MSCGQVDKQELSETLNNIQDMKEWMIEDRDRKSTRLNSSNLVISYAVFCLKKKTKANRANGKYIVKHSYGKAADYIS